VFTPIMVTRQIDLFCTVQRTDAETSAAAPNGGFARYRPTAVTTLRDQPPNVLRTCASRVLGPDGGEACNQRVVEHEEPAEMEPSLSKIITS
jgi:hypothetical protein